MFKWLRRRRSTKPAQESDRLRYFWVIYVKGGQLIFCQDFFWGEGGPLVGGEAEELLTLSDQSEIIEIITRKMRQENEIVQTMPNPKVPPYRLVGMKSWTPLESISVSIIFEEKRSGGWYGSCQDEDNLHEDELGAATPEQIYDWLVDWQEVFEEIIAEK